MGNILFLLLKSSKVPTQFCFLLFFNFFKDTLIDSSPVFWEHYRINPMPHYPPYKLYVKVELCPNNMG
jgi:hypothetical protein